MRRNHRFSILIAVTAVAALTLSACGDKTSGADDGATSVPTMSGLTRANFNTRMFKAVEKAGSAKVHFEAAGDTSGDGEVKYGDPFAMRMKMSNPAAAGSGPQEVLLIGDTFYLSMGGQYMTMSLDAMSGNGVPDLRSSLDPKIQADAFDKAVTDFKQEGAAETIDGVKATPYVVTIDPTKAPDAFGTSVTHLLTFTYFVGPDDLPRKMVYSDDNGSFTATYTDWGAPVDIQKPTNVMQAPAMH